MIESNVGTWLTRAAELNPNKPALVFEDRAYSYEELNERSNRWADAFLKLGVKPGARVGLLLMNCSEYMEAYFGLAKIGLILVPLNWRLTPLELEYVCNDSGLEFLIFGQEMMESVEAVRDKVGIREYMYVGSQTPNWAKNANFTAKYSKSDPELEANGSDMLFIMYTSGTTGFPKGVILTHEAFSQWCFPMMEKLHLRDRRVLLILPLFHAFGLAYATSCILGGCTAFILKSFDPKKNLETIQEEKIETFAGVPTMLHLMAQIPRFDGYIKSVRLVVSGAASIPISLMDAYRRSGVQVLNLYGSTEVGPICVTALNESTEKAESVGLPVYNNRIRLADDEGFSVPQGEVGEVLVKGPTVLKSYWNNPRATEDAFKEGWFCTGDLARLDDDGYLYLLDRKKDMIKSGGERVYPAEVEKVLTMHPIVSEVVVFGQPDETWGESVCAVIRVKEGSQLSAEEVVNFCKGKLARFKIPKHVVFYEDQFPRNGSGKILRRALREQLARKKQTIHVAKAVRK